MVLVRGGAASLDVLLLQRHRDLAFAGGAWVFPGGRLDEADFGDDTTDLERAQVVAAARECAEESGIAVEAGELHRWSHWTPPPQRTAKRFSTAFFVTAAEWGDVVVDGEEIVAHQWCAPATALELQAAGEIVLSPPTYITLHQLAEHGTAAELLAAAPARTVEHFTTHIGLAGNTVCALYHGDAAYESCDLSLDGPRHRLWMGPGPWRYERDGSTLPS